MEINNLGIVGSGIMGQGIAWRAALSGLKVKVFDTSHEALQRAQTQIGKMAAKASPNGEASANSQLKLVSFISQLEDLDDSDLVVEAVWEDLETKKVVFSSLERICSGTAIFASNTSALSITDISLAVEDRKRVVGMHFFNPPHVISLVEIIRGYYTADETVDAVCSFAHCTGLTPVQVRKDSPGFIVNRILTAQFVEAIKLVEEGVATPEDIDQAVKLGLRYPMGPFALQDLIGLDTLDSVLKYFADELDVVKWQTPQALRTLVRLGRYGKKNGAGWYDYQSRKE